MRPDEPVAVHFIAQTEYCNFVYQRHFPIHKILKRSCEIGPWRLTATGSAKRLTQKLRGKLATVIEAIEHGHRVFRVNFKNALLRQSEKFSCCLRNGLLSSHLTVFELRRGLDHLDAVRQRFQAITGGSAGSQAQVYAMMARTAFPFTSVKRKWRP
jgi:hypothetical protein